MGKFFILGREFMSSLVSPIVDEVIFWHNSWRIRLKILFRQMFALNPPLQIPAHTVVASTVEIEGNNKITAATIMLLTNCIEAQNSFHQGFSLAGG